MPIPCYFCLVKLGHVLLYQPPQCPGQRPQAPPRSAQLSPALWLCLHTLVSLVWWPASSCYSGATLVPWWCCIVTCPFGSTPNQCRLQTCVSADPREGAGTLPTGPGVTPSPAPWRLTLDIAHMFISSLVYDPLEDIDCCQFISTLSTWVSTMTCA